MEVRVFTALLTCVLKSPLDGNNQCTHSLAWHSKCSMLTLDTTTLTLKVFSVTFAQTLNFFNGQKSVLLTTGGGILPDFCVSVREAYPPLRRSRRSLSMEERKFTRVSGSSALNK